MLELFWSNKLKLFCDTNFFMFLSKMLEFFLLEMVFENKFSIILTKSSIIANFAAEICENFFKIAESLSYFLEVLELFSKP